uniref:Uncharacterized protein n=1 Tax=Ascaris lumbricoides TaxID=6252 RepID=A0A0M3HY28_ASCLU
MKRQERAVYSALPHLASDNGTGHQGVHCSNRELVHSVRAADQPINTHICSRASITLRACGHRAAVMTSAMPNHSSSSTPTLSAIPQGRRRTCAH